MRDVELRLPPDVQYVGLARLVVTVAARQAGMAAERIEDLKIAVSEATTNAIVAHQRTTKPPPVMLSFGTVGNQFAVSIDDGAPSDDASDVSEWLGDGGLGVTLIRGLADDVEFSEPGNVVHMRFAMEDDDDFGGGEDSELA